MILIIDNYDSFTFNLVQYLGELGAELEVRRNDQVSVEEIEAMDPERIVVSPGPCTPAEAGVSVDVIRRLGASRPVLGVCLGHQAIGAAFGGKIVRAAEPMHGKVSSIVHTRDDLFRDLPSPMRVTRYHSLVIEPSSLPEELEVIAWTDTPESDEIQAVRHRELPIWGVQFHPESIASEHGKELLANFLRM